MNFINTLGDWAAHGLLAASLGGTLLLMAAMALEALLSRSHAWPTMHMVTLSAPRAKAAWPEANARLVPVVVDEARAEHAARLARRTAEARVLEWSDA